MLVEVRWGWKKCLEKADVERGLSRGGLYKGSRRGKGEMGLQEM
jgi:hypothetical protein